MVQSKFYYTNYKLIYTDFQIPIQTSLLRHSSNDSIRTSRQCFLAIMRFMGDHTMTRGQTDIDCLFYLLKVFIKLFIFIS